MTRIRLQYVHAFRDRHGTTRYYFRRPGFKQIALPGLPYSAEFMEAYQAALAGVVGTAETDRREPHQARHRERGHRRLFTSRSLFAFAPGTQEMRRAILERFRDAHGDKRIATLPQTVHRAHVCRGMGPGAARNWLKGFAPLARCCRRRRLPRRQPDAWASSCRPHKTDGRHAWHRVPRARAVRGAPCRSARAARLAFALSLETGQRRGDVDPHGAAAHSHRTGRPRSFTSSNKRPGRNLLITGDASSCSRCSMRRRAGT